MVLIPVFLYFDQLLMKLLTKALLSQFEKVGIQSKSKDPLIVCKYFHVLSSRTWYASEYEAESRLFF